ncbi:hypothetical protein JTE90_001847 [Oedothorax gibbosus]|uniref:TIR domain-containing protein n=1 Tax=Oedothorax gibbosus TaxID=931172 RepID=A0AAV6VMU7_9ARAC|nr:hypothetical protein JTE90_001847 [Oedothorax gibbosus]
MENLLLFFVLFLLMFPCIPSQQCSLRDVCHICGGEENDLSICKHTKECSVSFCDDLENGLKGWKYICLDSCNTYLELFQVKYVADESVTFECGEYEPYLKSVFHQVNLSRIKAFSFKNCSIPSTSYSDIIPYQEPVEHIKIESVRDNGTFRSEMFGNISSMLKNLILSGNNIDVLPETMFRNSLSDINDLNQENWENLTELYLDQNQIQNLYNWQLPVNLKNLSLTGNNISYVPHSFMNSISNHKKLQISMGSNPLNCNCSANELKKWLAEQSHIITDVKEITCANHVSINGTLVRSIILTTPDNILCPGDDSPYKLHLIFVTVTCVILACLLVLVSALYYRNKQTVIAYVYIHMHQVFTCFFSEEDLDEDKMFDAFLSYSTSDRDIALLIREELEDKDPHFRVCIHERNWIAGNPISWNIFNSVQNSKRTILLISKEFLESMWFQVEFHTAYYQMLEDKIDRLIIIVKGQLPPKETMDKNLQYLLTTKTYLLWEEKWFWEKLKYALPHKRHQLVPNDVLALKDRPASEKIKPIETQIAILSNGETKSREKLQEVIQNHTNSTMNLVNKDSSKKK